MSIKSKVLATAATLTLVGGVGLGSVLTAGAANAATPSCGNSCINVYNYQFGSAFLLDVYKQGANVNQPIILFQGSNTDPAEDFVVDVQAPVSALAALGLVSPLVALHYGSMIGYELQYQPFGTPTGLCAGVGATPVNGTPVSLQPCGVSGKTIWIVDTKSHDDGYGSVPLISGATTTFTFPQVLTYPGNAYPTDMPRPQLETWELSQFSHGYPHTFSNQLWNYFFGVF